MELSLLPSKCNKKIGRAMADYQMLADKDRVLVAVSGGVDSLVTAWVLRKWRDKAPIDYHIEAVYVDNGFWTPAHGASPPAERIGRQLERFGLHFFSVEGWKVEGERTCFICARNRRSQLFELARQKGFNKLALGHHKDDLIETFLINALYSGNISTMVPRQDLFEGRLSLIRVLAYLKKSDIIEISRLVDLAPVESYCPIGEDSRRETVRSLLQDICKEVPDARNSIFSALGNVRDGYML
ncbi:MAG: tRNA 2-thiocytidine biosynthesis protein TtcA [Desulfofustis sp.]|nr:tRNA 2-thiocytidine biosynthesis protein TtcA [Desulfofustis sp.]